MLNVSKCFEDAFEPLEARDLLHLLALHGEFALCVAHQRRARLACVVRVYSEPSSLELCLNQLETIESRRVAAAARNLLLRIVMALRQVSILRRLAKLPQY